MKLTLLDTGGAKMLCVWSLDSKILTFANLEIVHAFCCLLFLSVWIQIRPHILLGLI